MVIFWVWLFFKLRMYNILEGEGKLSKLKKKKQLPRKEKLIEKKHVIFLLDSFFNFLKLYNILYCFLLLSLFQPFKLHTHTRTHYNRASTQTQSYDTLCLCVYYYINLTHATSWTYFEIHDHNQIQSPCYHVTVLCLQVHLYTKLLSLITR